MMHCSHNVAKYDFAKKIKLKRHVVIFIMNCFLSTYLGEVPYPAIRDHLDREGGNFYITLVEALLDS